MLYNGFNVVENNLQLKSHNILRYLFSIIIIIIRRVIIYVRNI